MKDLHHFLGHQLLVEYWHGHRCRSSSDPRVTSECERTHHPAGQPLRPGPAPDLRQVQASPREKWGRVLRYPVHVPSVLQQQEFQVPLGAARLAPGRMKRQPQGAVKAAKAAAIEAALHDPS